MNELDLFAAAIGLSDSDQRSAFLDRECTGLPELRQRIQQLLDAHFRSNPMLDPTNLNPNRNQPDQSGITDDFTSGDARAGTVIDGKYTLVEVIGEGGMGSVWRAKQTEPVKRSVAIKLIKAGMDSRQVLARFNAERQALALMDHPNISKVLDGGLHEQRPYFVMELVKGVPITEYCDKCRLTPRQRLELFVPVCQAIQHAHQKGIIHRDIKPSNVLIALYDDTPVAKVIDFGVAKATGGALTDSTIDTGLGAVVGTPQYMSPEQATFNNLDIDTRSDIYALGVLLYELLTGSPPFAKNELEKKGLLEMLRVVREVEPPRPSTKLSTADALPTLSANRGTEPKQLTGLLRNELDWIVMKALEKDRAWRYETANGFAADVQRYLGGEAVLAHPPSRSYRLRKFLRKHRGPVLAASLVAIALVCGMISTTYWLQQAREQTRIAFDAATAKEEARRQEAEQRELAERATQQAFDALKSFTDELMGKLLGSKDRLTETETAILQNAQKQWDVFAQSKGQSPQARVIQSEGAAELALIQYKLGLTSEAVANDRRSLELRSGLAKQFPDDPGYRRKLGMSYQNLGGSLRGSGNRAEAEVNFAKAAEVFASLVAEFPEQPDYQSRLSESLTSLGNSTRDRGDLVQAIMHYRAALEHQEKLVADHPTVTDYRESVGRSHWGLGFTKKRQKEYTEAEGHYRIALSTYRELANLLPLEVELRQSLAGLHRELGVMLSDSGNDAKGTDEFLFAIEILGQLASEYPSIPAYQADLARTHRDYGQVLRYLNRPTDALEQFGKAELLFEKLVANHPTILSHQADLSLTYRFHGDLYMSPDDRAQSLEWYDKAIHTLTIVYLADPKQILRRNSLSKSHAARATTLDALQRHTDALTNWDKAIELGPDDDQTAWRAARATSRIRAGQVAEAVAEVAELSKLPNWTAGQWYNFACCYSLASSKVADKQDEYTKRAVELLQQAVQAGFENAALMQQDTDLAALRDREDFRSLLAELEKQAENK